MNSLCPGRSKRFWIWEDSYDEDKGELPLVLPIVFYHGERSWNAPLEFSDLLPAGVEPALEQIPDFAYMLCTLEELVDSLEEITESRLRLYIKALRVARADSGQELADRLTDYARELAGDDWDEAWIWRDFVRPTLRYILETADPESGEVIDVVKKEVPERSDEIMTVADELRREGKTETLIDLLEDKIHGNISQKTREKLKDSGDETLDRIKSKFMEIETEADIKKLI